MNHTEKFNLAMERNKPAKKEKLKPVIEKMIPEHENMSLFQRSLSKCTYAGNTVYLPKEKLTNYIDIRKALIDAGAKYKNNTFIFPNDAEPFVNRLMGGEEINIKKQFQFFPTPKKLVQMILSEINFFEGAKVLEPSAGQGAFLDELPKDKILKINCIELMPENCIILTKKGYSPIEGDFLSDDLIPLNKSNLCEYDFIVANPPFSKNQDIDHFHKMYNMLKINGRMDVIVSPHFTYAKDKKGVKFKQFLEDSGATWQEINAGEFKESGTNIKTVWITLRK